MASNVYLSESQIAAGRGSSRVPQGLQQATFVQRKLKNLYEKTYKYLVRRKDCIETTEDVLVWRRPFMSTLLYIAVHWLFVLLALMSESSVMTCLGNLLLWSIIADIMWRAAINQFGSRKTEGVMKLGSKISKEIKRTVSFESAVVKNFMPLMAEQLPAFEVICLWIAGALMWLDNLSIALRHWSVNEPYLFFLCLLFPGIVLSLLGKYVPTIVVAYILVISVLTWPYIEYHDLRAKVSILIQTHFPQVLDKLKIIWINFKSFVSKDKTEFVEIALNYDGDEQSTEQALQDAFEQATALNTNGRRIEDVSSHPLPAPPSNQPNPPPAEHYVNNFEPPTADDLGMSVVQDSVLGMRPDAFLNPDESFLAVGSSLYPSTSSSTSNLEESISLPQFPVNARGHSEELSFLSSINEEDTAPRESLDPFLDSMEIEFGGYNFTDSRSPHFPTNTRPHLPIQPSMPTMDLVGHNTPETSQPRHTGFNTGYETRCAYQGEQTVGFGGTYLPPPPYQAAVDGSDGSVSTVGSSSFEGETQQDPLPSVLTNDESNKGGYWLRQRH